MTERKKNKPSKRPDTPKGETKKELDLPRYLNTLNDGHVEDILARLSKHSVDLARVELYRLDMQGRYDVNQLERAIRDLSRGGERFWICQVRVSSDGQAEDGVSLAQQERDNVIAALEEGATRVLVVVETYSAAAGNERGAFSRLVHAVRQGLVHTWVTAQLDRVTRNPAHAVEFVEALQASNTKLRSSTHTGPVNPYEALILMLQFIMAAFHIVSIKAGNFRGWRKRLEEGRWPNPAHPLPGMELDDGGRPSWTPAAKAAIPWLFAALDPESNLAWDSIEEALEDMEGSHPQWWKTKTDSKCPSVGRIRRLLGSTCVVDGKQKFEFRGDEREGTFPQLGGLVEKATFENVGRHVLYCESRPRTESSAWTRMFNELVYEDGHPINVIAAESEGTLQWSADGSFSVVCPDCGPASIGQTRETDPHFDDLVLADGSCRQNVRVPVFECGVCATTFRPLSLRALRLLLGRARRLCCVRCHSTELDIATETAAPAAGTGEVVAARCKDCRQRFWIDPTYATPGERYRYFVATLPEPTRPAFRPEVGLGSFEPEGEA